MLNERTTKLWLENGLKVLLPPLRQHKRAEVIVQISTVTQLRDAYSGARVGSYGYVRLGHGYAMYD